MSGLVTTPAAADRVSPAHGAPGRPDLRTQAGPARQLVWLAAAEWTKLRSVRSTVISLLAMVVVTVGLGAAIAAGTVARWDSTTPAQRLAFDPASRALAGLFLGQLVIGVLGALVLSAEYSTGTIRATFSATPQRVTVLVVKTAVFGAVTFVVSLATCLAAFWVAQAVYGTKGIGTTIGAPGVTRVVIGGALYLTVVGVLGLGLAAILRHTAGTISTLFGLLLVLPILANFLPSDWQANIVKYLPGTAGSGIFQLHQDTGSLAPWTGFALFCGYALLALAGGALMLRRRDA
jgi:ABC-type transport system involved in multi-copper enzyme maturation permease subunit